MIPRNTIDTLLVGKNLNDRESEGLFRFLLKKHFCPGFQKQVLTLLRRKGEQPDELVGLVRAIQKSEKRIPSGRISYLVDGCGTGGDGMGTINISTIASIVAAGAGANVAKHGNRSISSQCGSADLLEALGVKIDAPEKLMLKALKECGMGYFHAPLYHPLFKAFQPVRSALGLKGVRTIFNLVGPFVNPLRPKQQMIGVFNREFVVMLAQTARKLGYKHILIVWADGMDELTTTGKSEAIEVIGRKMKRIKIDSRRFGFPPGNRIQLKGGDAAYNRKIARAILEGRDKSTRRDVVVLNAAAILYVSGRTENLEAGICLAQNSIDTKQAQDVLERLAKVSHDTE